MKQFLKNNLCLLLAVLCSLVLEGYGLALSAHGYAVPQEGFGSRIALAVLTLREGIFPWNMTAENEMMVMAEPEVVAEDRGEETTVFTEAEAMLTAENAGEIQSESTAYEIPEAVSDPMAGVTEEPETTQFSTVTEDYFSDAVFIGDSRIVGVCEYAGLKDTTFYAKTSMTIYKMMDSRVETTKDVRTVREGLRKHQFRKVYLMVGLNEIGVGNTEYFINTYRDVVQEIHELQPDALIYIQGILHVSKRLERKNEVFSNDTINRRNDALASLAEEVGAVYLDLNEVYDDEYGNLPASFTNDDVHLKANYYDLWREYYLTHAIELPESAAGESGEG